MLLIIESGSTKSDVLLKKNKKTIKLSFDGINPSIETESSIFNKISGQKTLKKYFSLIDKIFFFGAGCTGIKNKKSIKKIFYDLCPNLRIINIESDIYASSLACYDNTPIISCILGTGSNSCYFDGKNSIENSPSLGYILGDEGSATHLGKKILIDYFYKKLPEFIEKKFNERYEINKEILVENLYKKEKGNLFLSSFSPFLYDFKENEHIRRIIETSFDDFIVNHILVYKNCKELPICFVGSIAFYFKDILKERLLFHSLKFGKVIQKPIDVLSEKLN